MFDQASLAKAAGFAVEMRYIALRDFAMHVERIKARADAAVTAPPNKHCGGYTTRASGTFRVQVVRSIPCGSMTIPRRMLPTRSFLRRKTARFGS